MVSAAADLRAAFAPKIPIASAAAPTGVPVKSGAKNVGHKGLRRQEKDAKKAFSALQFLMPCLIGMGHINKGNTDMKNQHSALSRFML